MKTGDKRWISAVTFTVLLIVLTALATVDVLDYVLIVVLGAIAAGVAFFFFVFPGSRFFSIAFANFLAVYGCTFVFFKTANFAPVEGALVAVGFLMPIAAFLFGSWLRRDDIRSIVTAERLREERHLGHVFGWLVPVSLVGALTFFLPGSGLSDAAYDAVFVAAMALIALVVFLVSHWVCTFLLDTGLLFEEFFGRIRHLVAPAFAFFTFYSLGVIVFAAIYRIVDRYGAVHFVIDGVRRDITFAESLYFSVVTMSTVGYGDIVPASDAIRVIVVLQIMLGVVLLLFGVSEIINYSRERRHGRTR
jgi:voltage-gated potassium channel